MGFMSTIINNKTYSSAEAAELLGVNINTFQKLAREGKIRIIRVGKNYRTTGAALLEFLELPKTKNRADLLQDLHNAAEKIIPILKKENKDYGVFLHQAIAMHADDKSVQTITEDINRYVALAEHKKS